MAGAKKSSSSSSSEGKKPCEKELKDFLDCQAKNPKDEAKCKKLQDVLKACEKKAAGGEKKAGGKK